MAVLKLAYIGCRTVVYFNEIARYCNTVQMSFTPKKTYITAAISKTSK